MPRLPVDENYREGGGVYSEEDSYLHQNDLLRENPPNLVEFGGSGIEGMATGDVIQAKKVTNKPYRFNPPLHRLSRPQRVDFGSDSSEDIQQSLLDYLDETNSPVEYKNGWAKRNFPTLRLGRIVQSDYAMGFAAEQSWRYGFRFLYNPTSMTTAAARNNQVLLDPRSQANLAISSIGNNYQTHNFTLLLNRLPDAALADRNSNDYVPQLNINDEEGLRVWGTQYDLEFLYRACNGTMNTRDRANTGNIGMLMPNLVYLHLGPGIKHYGFVQSVQWNDVMFTQDMVPVRTEVQIAFQRMVDISPSDADAWIDSMAGIATDISTDETASTSNSTDLDAPTGKTPSPSRNQTYNDPSIPHGGNAGGKTTNSTTYMFNEVWDKFGDGFTSAHCWRAEGYGSPDHPGGHACDFIVSYGFASGAAKAHGDAVADWAMKNAKALGICYIIWWNRIWNASRDPVGSWRELGRGGNASNQHKDHIHISSLTSEDGGCT